ncbi:hypothetical protein ACFQY5_14945 [Paeniroseomonas aquatica]|uniref:rhamnosyltransferase WsaF family glycosyltransferase n=1 Tax=Paeniroseomonas aquatica TaxID=373043 RepID=UPI0036122D6C
MRTRFLQAEASRRLALAEQEAATLRETAGSLQHEAAALRERAAAAAAGLEAMRQDLARRAAGKPAPDAAALQAERDRIAGDYAAACRERDQAVATAAQALAAARASDAQRAALIASSSWRITRPLRVATGLLRGEPGYRDRLRRALGGSPPPQPGAAEPLALAAPSSAEVPALPGGPTPASTLIARSLPGRMVSFPDPGQPRRLTMVTDSISAGSLFGGVGTAAILAALLAKRQDMALRIVTRQSPPEPRNFGTILAAQGIRYDGNIEFLHAGAGGEGHALPMGDNDLLLTTSWWTTWAARNVAPPQRILYLLQEDERMFYPVGDEQLRCQEVMQDESLRFIVNTQALHDHLVQQGMRGVIAGGMAFEPAFPDSIYHAAERPAEGRRRFFFYARPHHARNLFLRGLEAVTAAIERGVLRPEDWEFHFVGANLPPLLLPGNVQPQVAQNLPWTEYAALVRSIDVGLSLMQTPHPSYPPLDLAASGAVVVTNRCGPKVSLEQYSRNILCVEPTVEGLVQGLAEAVALAADAPRRQANYAAGRINRDWEAAFAPVLDRLAAG